ncbi:MAG: apolipoprotein N-acyltransferase, partial [Bdellovibrionales bacterium]
MMFSNKKAVTLAFISLLSGFLGSFGFPPYDLFFLAIVSYGALFIVVEKVSSVKQACLSGLLWGVGFHVGGLWWIAQALLVDGNPYRWAFPLAVLGFPFLLSLFNLGLCGLYKKLSLSFSIPLVICGVMFSLMFFASEWLRGNILTGFPWNLPAYIWSDHLPLLQSLSVLGAYGLSALTLLLSVMLGAFCLRRDWVIALPVIALMFTFMGFYGWGEGRLKLNKSIETKSLARIIQPNIEQKDKWNPDLYLDHLEKIKEIAISDLSNHDGFDNILLILPETAMNETMLAQSGARAVLNELSATYTSKGKNLVVLTGALYSKVKNGDRQYFNSAFIFNSDGRVIDDYSKSHLVPFGEYIPFSSI